MNNKTSTRAGAVICAAAGAALCVAMQPVAAQNAPAGSSSGSTSSGPASSGPVAPGTGAPGAGGISASPLAANPYYLGVSEALTHDSNVYRIPNGPSDNYSSTSIFGGFDQPISRQRVFGRATVSANRYQDQTQLNNVSYGVTGGLDWQTIETISGNVDVGLNRSLVAPIASAGVPTQQRNIAETRNIDARARWGGPSLLTLEGAVGYSKLDYSAPDSAAGDARYRTGSLGLYYRPGARLRLGVAARVNKTTNPNAFIDPATSTFQSNQSTGKNLDLLADYELTGLLSTNTRLSYTKQTNSGGSSADFSGLTGSFHVGWRATGKTSLDFNYARDTGYNASPFTSYGFVQQGTTIVLTPVSSLFENNQVTDSLSLTAAYAATGKISANAAVRYTRAKLIATNTTATTALPSTTDVSKSFSLGANYAITRNIGASCSLSHENRDVTGATVFSYKADVVGCSAQFIWQ
jgi:hypothetical protein